ncbi:MAG: MoaD/ThiS family protein [Bacteroidota bacterium]
MKLHIQVFGVLTEIVNSNQVEVEVSQNELSAAELRQMLIERYPAMALLQLKLAVNNQLVETAFCKENDSLALMPPFSGG